MSSSAKGRIFWVHKSKFQVGPICVKLGEGYKVKVKVKDISRSMSRSKVIQGQILQAKGSYFQVTLRWSRSRSKSNLRSRSTSRSLEGQNHIF